VPTLDDLLRPESARPTTFTVGPDCLYDEEKVGFAADCASGSTIVTSQPGDSNAGHSGPEYGTDLSDDDRVALIEYLKTL
jgi:hypothetical protein